MSLNQKFNDSDFKALSIDIRRALCKRNNGNLVTVSLEWNLEMPLRGRQDETINAKFWRRQFFRIHQFWG